MRGVSRRKGTVTTRRGNDAAAQDLVSRNFAAERANELWVADIERHEVLLDRVEVKGLHPWAVAAAHEKLRAA
jgi:hypothetical protein